MDCVRLGVIGCGGMAHSHMNGFANTARLRFTAASDLSPDNLKRTIDK